MDPEWLKVVDRIDDFSLEAASSDEWNSWIRRFKILLRATAFETLPDSRRVALLLLKCKGFMDVLHALEIDEGAIAFDEMVSKLTYYLTPVNTRAAFFGRLQGENESFDSFAQSLEALSRPCRILDPKIVRDVFLYNMDVKHAEIKRLIQSKHDPSFEEAVALANAMVSQGCVKSSLNITPPTSPPSLVQGDSGLSPPWNIRMVPITPGDHEVRILHVGSDDGLVSMCPMSMMDTREGFLDAFDHSMRKCKEPAVSPVKGSLYAALIDCKWHRVKVLAIEGGRKARVNATDIGWTKSSEPFNVFRNIPLDFRVVEPLMWSVNWKSKTFLAEPHAVVSVSIFRCENMWQAQPSSLMSNSELNDKDTSCQTVQPPKNTGNDERKGATSDGWNRGPHHRSKSPEGGGRQCEEPNHGINNVKDADIQDARNGGSSRATYFKQRSDRSYGDRDSRQDTFTASSHPLINKPNQGMGGNSSGRQHSAPNSSRFSQSSEDPSSESRNRGANGIVNGQRHSAFPGSNSKDAGKSVLPSEQNTQNITGTRNFNASSRQPAGPTSSRTLPRDSCPIPLNRYTQVNITYISKEGKLFCTRSDNMDKLADLCEELSSLGNAGPRSVAEPREGGLCMAQDESNGWLRAEMFKIHPNGLKAKIRYIDIGSEDKKNVSELGVLPQNYWDIPAYAFPIEVPRGVQVTEDDALELMPDFLNEDGVWNMKVRTGGLEETPVGQMNVRAAVQPALQPAAAKEARTDILPSSSARAQRAFEPAAAQPTAKPAASRPTLKPSSVRARTAESPRPPRPPPIPKNTFSKIVILYAGPEGTFAIDGSNLDTLTEIQREIGEITLGRLTGAPEIDRVYVAPYEGGLYRARVLEALNGESCRVSFVDFGNESSIPILDLKCIPEELCGNVRTFKIRLGPQSPVTPEAGMHLEATPVVLEADGSWLVRLSGESTSSEHSLHEDDDVVAFRPHRRS